MTILTRDEAATEIDRLVQTWNDTAWDERCISCEARAERVEADAPVDMPPVARAWAYGLERKGALIQNTFAHGDDCRVRNAISEAATLAGDWGFELELGKVIHKVKGDRVTYLMIVRRKPD